MNGKKQAYDNIVDFIKSDDKCLLLTGTHQYEKHKLIMKVIHELCNGSTVLFRTNGMQNIPNNDFIGFAGIKKVPKAGEFVSIGRNKYSFDSFNSSRTWSNSSYKYDFAIVYPIDYILRSKHYELLDDVFQRYIKKVFLVSWTDRVEYDYDKINISYDRHVLYDAYEEDEAYHNRVLNLME